MAAPERQTSKWQTSRGLQWGRHWKATPPGLYISCISTPYFSRWQGILGLGVPDKLIVKENSQLERALWARDVFSFLGVRKVDPLCSGRQPPLWPVWWETTSKSWDGSHLLQTPGTRRRLLSCRGFLKLYFLFKKRCPFLPLTDQQGLH